MSDSLDNVLDKVRTLMRRHGKITTKMVANSMNLSVTTVRKHMNKLAKKGFIQRLGKGRATVYSYK